MESNQKNYQIELERRIKIYAQRNPERIRKGWEPLNRKEIITNIFTDIDDKYNTDQPLTDLDRIIYRVLSQLGY